MSIQAKLNNESLQALPKLYIQILHAPAYERNQMICKTLHLININMTPLIEMDQNELENFEDCIINNFKMREWL